MNAIYSLLIQTTPILLGIAAMLMINAMKLGSSKIRIRSQSEIRDEGTRIGISNMFECHDAGVESGFEKEVRDRLIENGCMGNERMSKNLRKLGFERLGIIEGGRLKDLAGMIKQSSCGRLSIFANDREDLLRHVLHFSPSSGVLLSYLANYKVDVSGA